MRPFPFTLVLLSSLLSVGAVSTANAWDPDGAPRASSIEDLVRERLENGGPALPSYVIIPSVVVEGFDLVTLERISRSRWLAEAELLIDHGPPAPSVIGFERVRRGRYELLIERRGAAFVLLKISAAGRIHPLPGVQSGGYLSPKAGRRRIPIQVPTSAAANQSQP